MFILTLTTAGDDDPDRRMTARRRTKACLSCTLMLTRDGLEPHEIKPHVAYRSWAWHLGQRRWCRCLTYGIWQRRRGAAL